MKPRVKPRGASLVEERYTTSVGDLKCVEDPKAEAIAEKYVSYEYQVVYGTT